MSGHSCSRGGKRAPAWCAPRRPRVYVRGSRPIAWLKSTRSSIRQQLRRYRNELAAFEGTFGNPDVAVSTFMAGDGARVEVIDIEQRLPELFAASGV